MINLVYFDINIFDNQFKYIILSFLHIIVVEFYYIKHVKKIQPNC